jgi:hypothetical protein
MGFLHLARLCEIYVQEADARNLKVDTGLKCATASDTLSFVYLKFYGSHSYF